jgi:hypothetical protein
MSIEEKRKVEKVPWLYIIIFSAFLGSIGTWWELTTAPGITGRPAQTGSIGIPTICTSGMTTLPFMTLLVVVGLSKLQPFRNRVKVTTLNYIYIITLACSFYVGWLSPCSSWGVFIGARILDPQIIGEYISWFMAPDPKIVSGILPGGMPVPWGDLLPSMIFWWIYTLLNAIMMLSWATIFRRNWIDVEKVPFPHVIAAYELLNKASPKEGNAKRIGFLSPFSVGIILGTVFQLPIMMSELFPWFPDIYGWRVNTCTSGQWYVSAGSPLSGIVGFATAQKDPLGMAIAYLAPLSVLFNIWFWYLVCIIVLPQIAYAMGYYTGITDLNGCGRIWCGENLAYGPPFKWQAVSVGAALGLAAIVIFLSHRYLVETINAALGRLSAERRIEVEKNEPVSYRTTYMIMAGTFVLLVALYLIMGLSLASALVMQISALIFWLAFVRQVGIAGFFYMGENKGSALARLFLYPTAPDPLTRDFVLTFNFTNLPINSPENGFQLGGNSITSFSIFRMADLTSMNNRNVFLTMAVASIVLPMASLIGYYYTTYTIGLSKLPGNYASSGCDKLLNSVQSKWNDNTPASDPWIPYFLAGFVITAALSVLHSRFIWFPFEPVGFSLAISKAVIPWGIWSSALIAWVVKTITLKVGGSKAYESWGVPVAAGFIAGYMLVLIPGTIIAHIKFWYPF